jgi:carbon-monoxide dehydrogenase medium subunit
VGPTAINARKAADHLLGRHPNDADLDAAAEIARDLAQPVSDLRGPAEYKQAMVHVLGRRALMKSRDRARGGG